MNGRMMIGLVAAAALVQPAMAQQADPAGRVAAYHDGIIAIMKAKLPLPARRDRFEALLRDYYDMPAIAGLVVGQKWAATSPADREAAIAALTRHSALSLAKNFVSWKGEKFVTDPAAVDRGTSKVVRVRIGTDTLLYVVRGGRIIDVVSGGVSQLAVQRAEVASTVAGGGAAGLAKRLAQIDAAAR